MTTPRPSHEVTYRRALATWRAALTRHGNEQRKGWTDKSVRQTRRMALAVASLQRAHFRFQDAARILRGQPMPKPRTPLTGQRCSCRRGMERDNCPTCEGTGNVIDFRAIHAARLAREQAEKQA